MISVTSVAMSTVTSKDADNISLLHPVRKRRRLLPAVVSSTVGSSGAGNGSNRSIGQKQPTQSTTTPTTKVTGTSTTSSSSNTNTEEIESKLVANLRNPTTRIHAINELLKLTASHEVNYAMSTDELLLELVHICINDCFQWDTFAASVTSSILLNDDNDDDSSEKVRSIQFRSKYAWRRPPTNRMHQWMNHCSKVLVKLQQEDSLSSSPTVSTVTSNIKIVEAIIVIIRNLSYVGNNLRLLVYTPELICVLVACMSEYYSNSDILLEEKDFFHIDNDQQENSLSLTGFYSSKDTSSTSSVSSISRITNTALTAIQTVNNLTKYLDITGQQIFCDKLFYNSNYVESIKSSTTNCPTVPSCSSANKFGWLNDTTLGFGSMYLGRKLDIKDDTILNINLLLKENMLVHTVGDYLVSVWSIFPAVCKILCNRSTPRTLLLSSLDLLQEFINQASIGVVGDIKDEILASNGTNSKQDHSLEVDGVELVSTMSNNNNNNYKMIPTLRALLVNMPDTLIDRLIDLLYVPRLGPDALDYVNPITNIVTRVTALKLLMGYDATIDADIRDRILEILVPLLQLDTPRMAVRFGTIQRHGCCVVQSSTTTSTAGTSAGLQQSIQHERVTRVRLFDVIIPILTTTVGRNDAPILSGQLLRELSLGQRKEQLVRIGLVYIQDRLIEIASRNDSYQRLASILITDLYPLPEDEESEEEESAQDDDTNNGNEENDDNGHDDDDEPD